MLESLRLFNLFSIVIPPIWLSTEKEVMVSSFAKTDLGGVNGAYVTVTLANTCYSRKDASFRCILHVKRSNGQDWTFTCACVVRAVRSRKVGSKLKT